jgi:putative transposase
MVHRRPPRLKTFDYRGRYSYFVTCGVESRRRACTTAEVVECLREQILRTCREKQFSILAYVFMPDHLHLLIEGLEDECAFRPVMTLMRQRTALAYRRLS